MSFATDTELIARIEKIASDSREPLSIADHALITRRNAQAYDTIVSALRTRGLSKTQADTWTRGKEFQLDIATHWVLLDIAEPSDNAAWITRYDRESALATVELLDAAGNEIGNASAGFSFKPMNLEQINDNLGI